MTIEKQHEALKNAANRIGAVVHYSYSFDKRKKTQRYYATKNGSTVSPTLDFTGMQLYLLGWIQGAKL